MFAAGIGVAALIGAWAWSIWSVETPEYRVVDGDGAFEVRRYAPMVTARVKRPGDRGTAVRAAFGPLSRYIFARDRAGEKIAMTAPVTQEPAASGWTVSFIMPAGRTTADLPQPASDMSLVEKKRAPRGGGALLGQLDRRPLRPFRPAARRVGPSMWPRPRRAARIRLLQRPVHARLSAAQRSAASRGRVTASWWQVSPTCSGESLVSWLPLLLMPVAGPLSERLDL